MRPRSRSATVPLEWRGHSPQRHRGTEGDGGGSVNKWKPRDRPHATSGRRNRIFMGMTYTDWLRRQVSRLEEKIRAHSVFDTDSPATPAELKALRSKVVIHTY